MRKILASVMPVLSFLVAVVCFLPPASLAHTTRLSSSQLQVNGSDIQGVLEINGLDLEVALSIKLRDQGEAVSAERAKAQQDRIFEYLQSKIHPVQGTQACPGQVVSFQGKGDHLLVALRWQCSSTGQIAFESVLFQEIDPASRHMLTATGDARAFALLSASSPRVDLVRAPSKLGTVLWQYFLSGVEHIAIGYDHIAFLIAVILWGRRFWPLAAVVTAFTVAHSITLSLAVLDVVRLPSQLVETLIALSIVYVAAENFFVRDISRRWIITFLFGLIHGFGFASVLREYGVPQDRVGWALAAFNVGVEAGQLLIVGAALSILYGVGRIWIQIGEDSPARRRFVWAVSAIILALGIYWAWQRISG